MLFRRTSPAVLSVLTFSLLACAAPSPTAPEASALRSATPAYTVKPLSVPSANFDGEARGINDLGFSAGFIRSPDGYFASEWNPGAERLDLGDLPGLPSDIANDINASGTIVGFSFGSLVSFARPFVRTAGGGMQALPDLGGNAGIAQAINSAGTIVGWAADSFGVTHAAKWDATGQLTDLNPPGGTSIAEDINDAGDIVGWTFPFGAVKEHAHLWRHDGVEIDLGTLGGAASEAFGVNNLLAIVGEADLPFPDPFVAFGWTPTGGMKDLGFGQRSQAFAVSDRGRAVGIGGQAGLTWMDGHVDTLPDLAPLKPHFSGPVNINRCGSIVGSSVSPLLTSAALLPVVWRKAACD